MKLWLTTAALILAFVALGFTAKLGNAEGRRLAYEMRLEACMKRWPKYRCEIQLYNQER